MRTVAVSTYEQTLRNLLEAFHRESNSAASYAAFALKADMEGYLQIGSLFRAASRAEQIHAANHAKIIENLGSHVVPSVENPVVRTTVENLQVAIANELYETDVLYPKFIKEAEEQMNAAARRSFAYAFEAEKEHAWLFTYALEQVQQYMALFCHKLSNRAIYYVCPACGLVTDKTDFNCCPACNHSRDAFRIVN